MLTKGKKIIRKLINNNFEAYFVGGYVRDKILGIESSDIDIVTSAKPNEIIDIFFNEYKINEVGKSFGVVLVDGIEVASYRKEKIISEDVCNHKNFNIEYIKTLEEDLGRRDLTINGIAMDIHGNIIDPFNGVEDIKNKTIRFIGDPQKRIDEDPDRIIRACRFQAKLEGKFSEKTFLALRNNAFVISYIAPERIRKEIMKAMEIKFASSFFMSLHLIGALEKIFPSMELCTQYDSELHGKYHDEGVFEHMLMVGDYISTNYPLLKLTGYLHDIGKPYSAKNIIEKGGITFYDHHIIGRDCIIDELKKLKFSNDEIHYISSLIRVINNI